MCGTAVVADTHKVPFQERICSWLKVAMIISAIMTVISIFADFGPSFTKCSVSTLVLGLAKSSAEQMTERR